MRPLGCRVLAGQRMEVREREAVWSCFTRSNERMETGGSLVPRVGLERRNKNRVLIKGKSQRSNSHLIFSQSGGLVDLIG